MSYAFVLLMRYFIPDRDLFFITIDDVVMGFHPREMDEVCERLFIESRMTVEEGIFLYFTAWI